jgi:hypothetical protein
MSKTHLICRCCGDVFPSDEDGQYGIIVGCGPGAEARTYADPPYNWEAANGYCLACWLLCDASWSFSASMAFVKRSGRLPMRTARLLLQLGFCLFAQLVQFGVRQGTQPSAELFLLAAVHLHTVLLHGRCDSGQPALKLHSVTSRGFQPARPQRPHERRPPVPLGYPPLQHSLAFPVLDR